MPKYPKPSSQLAATVLADNRPINDLKDEMKNGFTRIDTELAVVTAKLDMIKWIIEVDFGVLLLILKSFWSHG